MPQTNERDPSGHVWLITHRCRDQTPRLDSNRDRLLWRRWLFEARRCFGLQVLNYIARRDRVHLLVRDRGEGEIGNAMQLVGARTSRSFHGRRHLRGTFWEDRYQAMAVDNDEQLRRYLVCIDLSIVRSRQVRHPRDWDVSGYQEIQRPRARYRIIDTRALMAALRIDDPEVLRRTHWRWIEDAMRTRNNTVRDDAAQDSRAGQPAGSSWLVGHFRNAQDARLRQYRIETANAGHRLREEPLSYNICFDEEAAYPGSNGPGRNSLGKASRD